METSKAVFLQWVHSHLSMIICKFSCLVFFLITIQHFSILLFHLQICVTVSCFKYIDKKLHIFSISNSVINFSSMDTVLSASFTLRLGFSLAVDCRCRHFSKSNVLMEAYNKAQRQSLGFSTILIPNCESLLWFAWDTSILADSGGCKGDGVSLTLQIKCP